MAPKPVTVAVSGTHCCSPAKKARVPSRIGSDMNISKMGQGSCRLFALLGLLFSGLPHWRMATDVGASRLWPPTKGQDDYSFCTWVPITTISSQGTGSFHPSFSESV